MNKINVSELIRQHNSIKNKCMQYLEQVYTDVDINISSNYGGIHHVKKLSGGELVDDNDLKISLSDITTDDLIFLVEIVENKSCQPSPAPIHKSKLFENGNNDINALLNLLGNYQITIHNNDEVVLRFFKSDYLLHFFDINRINYKDIVSQLNLSKNIHFILVNSKVFLINLKYQNINNLCSLEKCDFEKKQYKKLFARLNIDVEYIYILNDWFRKSEYRDILDYIHSVGCDYYFQYIPLEKFGLPIPSGVRKNG